MQTVYKRLLAFCAMLVGIESRGFTFNNDGSSNDKKVYATSITGPYKLVIGAIRFMAKFGLLDIARIAMFGVKKDGKTHIVMLESPDVALGSDDAKTLCLDGYNYAHKIAALELRVNTGLFDKGFNPEIDIVAKVFGAFTRAIFKSGKLRGTTLDSNVLLLLGRSTDKRVFVACQSGYQGPLKVFTSKLDGALRYAVSQANTIVAVTYGGNTIVALHVKDIARYYADGVIPEWAETTIEGLEIEEIAVVSIEYPTVVLTAKLNGTRQLIPANVAWSGTDENRTFTLIEQTKWATDMPTDVAPIVRLTATGQITAVDGNGGTTTRLQLVDNPTDYVANPDWAKGIRRIAEDTGSGQIAQAA